jgi:hypothetical protein
MRLILLPQLALALAASTLCYSAGRFSSIVGPQLPRPTTRGCGGCVCLCETEDGLRWPRPLLVEEDEDPLLVRALLLRGELEL